MLLTLLTVGCGESPSAGPTEQPGSVASGTTAEGEAETEAEAMRAAEATVRAYFSVKGRAEDPISTVVDEQAAYVTSRDVNPTRAYDEKRSHLPSGVTDTEKVVELANTRMVGDEVLVDFAAEWTSVSYMFIGDVMQLDRGQPSGGHWDGTATLEERNGAWLINDFTTVSYGGNLG